METPVTTQNTLAITWQRPGNHTATH